MAQGYRGGQTTEGSSLWARYLGAARLRAARSLLAAATGLATPRSRCITNPLCTRPPTNSLLGINSIANAPNVLN